MTAQVQQESNASQEQPKTPEVNLANMRKALEAERAEKAQMKQKLEELEKMSKQKPAQYITQDDEDTDEPYIDPKTFKKKMARFEESLDQKIERKAEEKARSLLDEQNKQNYLRQNTDFEQILSPEVVQKFADRHPAMAEAILRMPEGFERQKLVYEAIKSTGINKPEEKKSIQQTIDQNRKSPYYIPASSGTAPYSGSGDFSDTGQKNAYAKLQELKKNLRLR